MHKKNIKKGFFVNNKKRILSLLVVGILSTFSHDTRATTPALPINIQESTPTDQTTPQKTEKKSFFYKMATAPRCPYANTPLKKLTAEQL